eukprot:scaffold12278_cov104-Skeletonema_dohrnii-CCMP3373.AAC.5
MNDSRDYAYYKEHAQDVKLDYITSSERNKNIMQKLRCYGDSEFTSLYILEEENNGDDDEFIVQQSDDLGWLGYFIGQNRRLEFLRLSCDPPPPIGLLEGICRNRSIQTLEVKNTITDTTFLHLTPFFDGNYNLTSFTLGCFEMGSDVCAQYFTMALIKCDFLKHLRFDGTEGGQFRDDTFNSIIRALHSQSHLERLTFDEHYIGGEGYAALSNTLRLGGMGKLKVLDLVYNDIDDEGFHSLVTGMRYCRNLVELNLTGNSQITVTGLRALSDFFQSESCRLEFLDFERMDISDEGAIILATGLMGYKSVKYLELSDNAIGDEGIEALVSGLTTAANTSLETLRLSMNPFTTAGVKSLSTLIQSERSCLEELDVGGVRNGDNEEVVVILASALTNNTSLKHLGLGNISEEGGMTFSRLLCDTSSMNNIYSSNHTLEFIGGYDREPIQRDEVLRYLMLNRNTKNLELTDRRLVPMCKILIHHPDLADMKPFYKWKLKFLPMIADWFYRASGYRDYFEESVDVFQRRELSAMYKFIRGVPMLVADGFWSQQLKLVRVKKRNFEEAEKKQLLALLAKKRKLEEEEMQVLDRLSG